MIKGAENVSKYKSVIAIARLVMALPMLKILGHVIVHSELNDHDKKVFWFDCTMVFLGYLLICDSSAAHSWIRL